MQGDYEVKIPYIHPDGIDYIEQESAERMPTIKAYMDTIYEQRELLARYNRHSIDCMVYIKLLNRIIIGLGITVSILAGSLLWCLS